MSSNDYPDFRSSRRFRGTVLSQHCATLLELAVVLLIILVMLGLGSVISQAASERSQTAGNEQSMFLVQAQVMRFVIANNRIPCPDTAYDGYEDCEDPAEVFGNFPYRSLNMGAPVLDENGVPILYGANPLLQAPLTAQQAPWDYPASSQDNFCETLLKRLGDPFEADEPIVAGPAPVPITGACTVAGGAFNPAFALVSAGPGDADGDGSSFDGLNKAARDGASLCVENPGRDFSNTYNDQVRVVGMAELYGLMCLNGRDPFDESIWDFGVVP
jgi:competence protein ComGC